MTSRTTVGVALIAATIAACGGTPITVDGCVTNEDCTGLRVCVVGQCVAQSDGATGDGALPGVDAALDGAMSLDAASVLDAFGFADAERTDATPSDAAMGDAAMGDAASTRDDDAATTALVDATMVPRDVGLDGGLDVGPRDAGLDGGPRDGGPRIDAARDGGPTMRLSVSGAQLLDARGQVVVLRALTWFGFETDILAPHGLERRSLPAYLDQIVAMGFDTLRLPYCDEILTSTVQPNLSGDPNLVGLTPLALLDRVLDAAESRGLRVVLSRTAPTPNAHPELWTDGGCDDACWRGRLTTMATHVAAQDNVIGIGLAHEPHGRATWGTGDMTTDWRLAAERGGAAVLAASPTLLVFVEGIENSGTTTNWWGSDLTNAAAAPIRAPLAGHFVYEVGDYPASVYAQPWFSAADYPNNLDARWTQLWGYLPANGVAPIFIGQFGTRLETMSDRQWLARFVSYLDARGISFAYFGLTPDSGNTGGILGDDWTTASTAKLTALAPLLPR